MWSVKRLSTLRDASNAVLNSSAIGEISSLGLFQVLKKTPSLHSSSSKTWERSKRSRGVMAVAGSSGVTTVSVR